MKAYININQKAFIELSKHKNIKLDLIDATIFEYIYKFAVSNMATKQIIDNELFIWVSYQKIIDDNPLMNITSKKAIEIRLNNLVKVGLLKKYLDKKQGNKTYFNITNLAYNLIIENKKIDDDLSNENSEPLVSKITKLSNQNSEPLSKQNYYNSKLIDSKLNREKKKESVRSKLAYEDFQNEEKEKSAHSFLEDENLDLELQDKNLQQENSNLEENENKIIQTKQEAKEQKRDLNLEDFKNKFLQIQEKTNNKKLEKAKLRGSEPYKGEKELRNNQDLHPQDIIKAYKELISQKYEDITEIKSFNQILIHHEHLEAMLKGIKNYAKALKLKPKKPEKLFFFIRDKIYLDYQNEQTIELGKNEAIVPTGLVGVEFSIDGEQMKFLEDGYLKIDKNWKVTNAKDVLNMTQIVQKSINQKIKV